MGWQVLPYYITCNKIVQIILLILDHADYFTDLRFLLERLLEHEKKKIMVSKATSKAKPSVIQSLPRQQPLSRHQILPRQQPSSKQPLQQPSPRQLLKPVVTPSRIPRQRSPDSDSSGSDHAMQAPVSNMLSRKKTTDRSLPKKIQSIPVKEDGKCFVFMLFMLLWLL